MIEFDREQARFNMIEQQVRPWEVLDSRVLEVMASVPRERFVPEGFGRLAFADIRIPLGHGQVMLTPREEGRILQALAVEPGDRVLEIGTGSGYMAACLAALGAEVVSVDYFGDFVEQAAARHASLGVEGVTLRQGDAATGWREDGTFDAIAITASMPEPEESYRLQIHEGGRLFAVIGRPPVMQATLITRVGADSWSEEGLFETDLPPMVHAPAGRRFRF